MPAKVVVAFAGDVVAEDPWAGSWMALGPKGPINFGHRGLNRLPGHWVEGCSRCQKDFDRVYRTTLRPYS